MPFKSIHSILTIPELIFSPEIFLLYLPSCILVPTKMPPSNNEIMTDSPSELDLPDESYQLPLGSDINWMDMHKFYERDDSLKESTNPKSHSHLHNSKNVGSNSKTSIGSDINWMDMHKFYERDDSLKESTNPKSHSHLHNSKNVGSNSQRFSGNLMPGIIGLSGNIQNSSILGHSARRPSGIRIIPRKNDRNGKLAGLDNEPGSPKISCMGRVLSEKPKGSNRCRQISKAKKSARSDCKKSSKSEASEPPVKSEHKGPGCLLRMAMIFCGNKKRAMEISDESIRLEKESDSVSARIGFGKDVETKGKRYLERDDEAKKTVSAEAERDTPVSVPIPGIGGIKKFASGRKVDWAIEMDTVNSGEVKEGKSLGNGTDVKERNNPDIEKDTPVPMLVLGLGGLKRFASGRKVDWDFKEDADEGNMAKDETNASNKFENDDDDDDGKQWNSLEKDNHISMAVPVFGISVMKKFASGRKLDWNFEIENDKRSAGEKEAKQSSILEKSADNMDTPVVVSVPKIGSMKRFASGRKVEAHDNADQAEEKNDLVNKNHAKENNVLKKELDASVTATSIGIGGMKNFKSGRKMDWNFEVKGVRQKCLA